MKNQPWIDILPPPAPVEPFSWWLTGSLIFTLIVLAVCFYKWYHSPKQVALRQLNEIRNNLTSTINLNTQPLEIRRALKNRFNVTSIEKINLPDLTDWTEYKQQLTRLCFSNQPVSPENLDKLICDTRYWIKQQVRVHD